MSHVCLLLRGQAQASASDVQEASLPFGLVGSSSPLFLRFEFVILETLLEVFHTALQ